MIMISYIVLLGCAVFFVAMGIAHIVEVVNIRKEFERLNVGDTFVLADDADNPFTEYVNVVEILDKKIGKGKNSMFVKYRLNSNRSTMDYRSFRKIYKPYQA